MKFCNVTGLVCVMSVLIVADAYAADNTVITSKQYVDGLVANKQDKLTTTNVVSTGTGNVVTAVTASDGTVTVTKGNVDLSAKQDKLTTTNVVTSGSGNVVTGVTASNGTVTVTKGDIDVDLVSEGENVYNLEDATNKAPSVHAVQGGALYYGNTASANTKKANQAIGSVDAAADVFSRNTTVAADADAYVPTVAAVEARIKGLSVTSDMIVNGTIVADDLASSAVTSAKLASNAVTNAKLASGAVTEAKLAADAVTSAKIKDGEVKNADLADSAVTSAKLAADAVTSAKIADGTIVAGDLADSAVTSAKLAADAVTSAKVQDKSLQYQFDMNNTALYNVNTGAAPVGDVCTEAVPCMLTYYKKDSKVYTRWTPLDIDGLTVSTVATDAGASI